MIYLSAAHSRRLHQLLPATQIRHCIVVLDEFGDRSITVSLDTGISSPDEIKLKQCHS